MKKSLFIIIVTVATVCSCAKEPITQKVSQGKEYTIGIMPVGDISASYSPLTKAESAEEVWYGINIKRDNADYLFGVFNDISKFKIQLSTSHSYSFELTAIKGADEDLFVLQTYPATIPKYYYELKYPFYNEYPNDYTSGVHAAKYVSYYKVIEDGVVKNDIIGPEFLNILHDRVEMYHKTNIVVGGSGVARSDYDNVTDLKNISFGKNENEWYRFYGVVNNFTPSKDETLPFSLKHEGFGLQYSVSGICDGSVSVVIDNAQTENNVIYFNQPAITSDYSSPQKVIEFRDMTEETEQVKVTVVWTRGNNVVDNLGSTTVNVRRNKVNKINITLGEHSNDKTLSISTDTSEYFGSESKEITI